MGFKDFVNKTKLAAKYNGSLGPLALTADKLHYNMKKYSVVGAVAEIDTVDAPAPQATLTRIAAGAVIAGPVGAIVGGMLKKDRSKGFLTITLADGKVLLVEFPSAKISDARKLVGLINEASVEYAD